MPLLPSTCATPVASVQCERTLTLLLSSLCARGVSKSSSELAVLGEGRGQLGGSYKVLMSVYKVQMSVYKVQMLMYKV